MLNKFILSNKTPNFKKYVAKHKKNNFYFLLKFYIPLYQLNLFINQLKL